MRTEFKTKDYTYTLNENGDGWHVEVNNKDQNRYSDILEAIDGIPVNDLHGTFQNCKYMQESPRLPGNTSNLVSTYEGCTNLKHVPELSHTKIVSINEAFSGCVNIKEPPKLPPTVLYMYNAFNNCIKLENIAEFPPNVRDADYAYKNCESITHAEMPNSGTCVGIYENCISIENMPITVNKGDYNFTLNENGTGWSVNVNDKNKTEYGPIPQTINGIPVTNLDRTFENCRYMKAAPDIPIYVNSMNGTFSHCVQMETAPQFIPKEVENIDFCFADCNKLKIPPTAILNPNISMKYTFLNCETLKEKPLIKGYYIDEDKENEWHTYEGCKTLNDKEIVIYDYQGNSYKCNIPDIQDVEAIELKIINGDEIINAIYKDGSEIEYDVANLSGIERDEKSNDSFPNFTINYTENELKSFIDLREYTDNTQEHSNEEQNAEYNTDDIGEER